MKRTLDIDTWNRKDHFHFFRKFEEPFFGVCVSLDCTIAYRTVKAAGVSFFLYYLHKSLAAANSVEPFRYRMEEDRVIVYDVVHASPTIERQDGTFGFAYMNYHEDFGLFSKSAQEEIAQVQGSTGLIPAVSGENVIHFSSVPFLHFTSLSHARAFSFRDSIPKISFGMMTQDHRGKQIFPVSIHAHHALMDGYHIGQFVSAFQDLLNGGR